MFWYHFLPSSPKKPNWWFDRILKDASDLGVTSSFSSQSRSCIPQRC